MAKKSQYKGLANNFAEHSQSNLSWLHPHLAQDCRANETNTVTLDLLGTSPFPKNFRFSQESEKAVSGWRERFREMVKKIGLDISQIKTATVTFTFNSDSDYSYGSGVCVELLLVDGTAFSERPFVYEPQNPAKMVPGTDVPWPDKFNKKNEL